MKTKFRMTDGQHAKLLDACKPVPVMYLSGGIPFGKSQQENANDAWAALGKEMGFDSTTVEPCGSDTRDFIAETN